jgi:hypothetical protein
LFALEAKTVCRIAVVDHTKVDATFFFPVIKLTVIIKTIYNILWQNGIERCVSILSKLFLLKFISKNNLFQTSTRLDVDFFYNKTKKVVSVCGETCTALDAFQLITTEVF